MHRSVATFVMISGFLLFFFGFLAIIYSLVGLQLSFLAFIDKPGATFGFVIRLCMVILGMALLYIGRTKFEN